ncbi:hypothetical protein BDZ91DRAFT_721463 [Kalaharituber pfeilii]|nr:hypothetical protein BDZ91DRAFT_721463 [Kalaharituber pfeilii]
MTTTMFTASLSGGSLKRKRDELGVLASLDNGQAPQPPITGMGTLNLRENYTLQKLFSAQSVKQLTNQNPQQASAPSPQQKSPLRPSASSFFASFFTSSKPHPKPPAKAGPCITTEAPTPAPLCEDCEMPLQERELYLSGGGQCINCRRIVCSEGGCSVAVNDGWGGEGRVCLECALR